MIRLDDNSIKLCCGTTRGCPVITRVDGDTFTITDDFGKTITIKKDELALIGDATKILDNTKEKLICG